MAPSLETESSDCRAPRGAPGFYLLDDADGRFAVDPEFGFISLRDEATLDTERGRVHRARLRVVEPSGESYELDMRLKITGRVPQMLGPEEERLHVERSGAPQTTTALVLAPAAWSAFSALGGLKLTHHVDDEDAVFGALLQPALPAETPDGLHLALTEQAPAPSNRNANWLI